MKNKIEKIKIDPDFWEKVQIFDGSDIPKSNKDALWDDNFFEPGWSPYKKRNK